MRFDYKDVKKLVTFKFTGDKENVLWNKGKGQLAVYHSKTMTVTEYEKFWYQSEKNRMLEPVAAVYDKSFTKIFGVAKDNISSEYYLLNCNLSAPDKKQWTVAKKIDMQVVISYEVSFNRDRMYIGGTKSTIAILSVITLEDKMEVEHTKKFNSINMACVSNIKRIEGSEYILVSGLNTMVCLKYSKEKKQFFQIHSFTNISDGEIESSAYFRGFLFMLCPLTSSILSMKVPIDLSQNIHNQVEYPNCFSSGGKKVNVAQIQELTNALQNECSKSGASQNYFANLLDNYIEVAPRVLLESDEKAKENFQLATVFSLPIVTTAKRLEYQSTTNRMFVMSPDASSQYDLDQKQLKLIKSTAMKSRIKVTQFECILFKSLWNMLLSRN